MQNQLLQSNLVKTAVYGSDAKHGGRILCALGYSGEEFDPEKVDLYIESVSGKLKLLRTECLRDIVKNMRQKYCLIKK